MGDCRDLDILRIELESWANKKGKLVAIVPVLEQLRKRREVLLKKIIESSEKLARIVDPETQQPVAETTEVVIPAVRVRSAAAH